MAKKLPKVLYVKVEQDGDSHYFVADENVYNLGEMGEKIKIGTYKLVDTNDAQMLIEMKRVKG